MKKYLLYAFAVLVVICISSAFMDVSGESNEEVTKVVSVTKSNVKVVQIGAFTDQDSATSFASRNDGIVVEDHGYFCVYISVLHNENTIKRMEEYLNKNNINYYIKEMDIQSSFIEEISSLEKQMNKSSSKVAFFTLNRRILDIYLKYE